MRFDLRRQILTELGLKFILLMSLEGAISRIDGEGAYLLVGGAWEK